MALYKLTLVFEYEGYGWTESYVINLAGTPLPGVVFANLAVPLINARIPLLAQDCFLTFARLSTINVPFQVYTVFQNLQGQYGADTAFPNTALKIRFTQQAAGPEKTLFMRGIPFSIINAGNYTPTAQWQKSFGAYGTILAGTNNNVWGWYGVQSKVSSTLVSYTQNVVPPAQFQVNIESTTAVFTVPQVGTKRIVRLAGVNGKSELNGTQVVTVTSPTSCLTKDRFGVIPYSFGGTISNPTYGFSAFLNFGAEQIVSRKAGRALFLERGRQPNRART
jgi:hypothetical protein